MDPGLSLEKQIELHESEHLIIEKLVIENTSPATIDNQIFGKMIRISFHCDYDKTFTKKKNPFGVLMFDIGKIQYVMPGSKHNDGCKGILMVKYVDDNSTLTVSLHINNYASDSVIIPSKEHQ